MKSKFYNLLWAALAVMLFAGCTNIASNDAAITGGMILPGQCLVSVGVGETINEAGARTINPTTVYDDTSVFQKLELTGTSAKGASVNHVFTAEELTAKQAVVSLTYDKWYLTLTAYDGANAASAVPVLKGDYFADLTNTALTNIEFTLTPDGVNQAGSVELTVKFFDPYKSVADKKIDKCEAGLYKIDNNQLYAVGSDNTKMETSDSAFVLSDLSVSSSDPDSTEPNTKCVFTANNLDVEPGRYMFKIWFKTSSGRKTGFYSDVVVVAPGRKTVADVTVPDIMDRIPEKPENLKVLLVEGSEKNGFYKAHIKWTDNSTNEESFVLKVTEWSAYTTTSADTPVSTKVYGAEEDTATDEYYFWGSDFRADGTLGTSTTSCEVNLKLGVLYDFEIAAWNSCGVSEFEGRTACVAEDNVAATATKPALTGYSTSKVNRYKIDYDLSSGKLEKSATESYEGTYTEFKTYAGAEITLQAGKPAAGSADTYPIATRNHNPFVDWYYKPSTAAAATTISTYNNWENLSVWASYDPTYIISYTVSEEYGELDDTDVTAIADIASSSNVNCKNAVLDLTATGATNPVFTFTVAGAEAIKVNFGDKASRTAEGSTVELDTRGSTVAPGAIDPLEGKTYCVTVLALKQLAGDTASRWYSKVFAVTIKR